MHVESTALHAPHIEEQLPSQIDQLQVVVGNIQEELPQFDRLLTIPNGMTISRPALALKAARKLINNEVGVSPWVMAMAGSDLDGKVAWLIDKYLPDSQLGASNTGVALDPIADTLSFLTVSRAALKSDRIPRLAKFGIGAALASESIKTSWAAQANTRHILKHGSQLVIKPSRSGQLGTALRLSGVVAGVYTHDLPKGKAKDRLAKASFMMTTTGAALGELARRGYADQANSR